MNEQKKRPYSKPQVKSQKIKIGVYGCYGDDQQPTFPVNGKDLSGGTNLSG
jgi:hypothetical protein